jgi:tripartite-type tricarboxylate transporter receptor subunit TctC
MRLLALFTSILLHCAGALAQYPAKPIRLVVPFPPGGAADLTARVIVPPLSQSLGQPVVIENKAGGDGAIAGIDVMRSAADGYTLFFGTNTALCATPVMRKSPPYDPIADFTPISLIGKFGFFVFVNAELPAKSVAELLAYIRANPGKLNYGSGNSMSILASAQLAAVEKLDMVHIPYKGDAPASADLLAGRIQILIGTPGTLLPHAKEGTRIRALATLLETRSPLLPEVPTMAELGQKGISVTPFAGLFGPARMPREVVERLARDMAVVLARSDVRETVARHAFETQSSTPEELGKFLREQLETWRRTAAEVGIVPD